MAKQPLFEEIKDYIKKQIEDKKYLKGEKIPTEMEFAKMFNTSRQTVNKALRDLVLDDIVERSPRSGTFVKTVVPQTSVLDLKNIEEEINERENIYSNQLVSLNIIKADKQIAKILKLVKDEEVYISQMIHKENGVPVRFDTRYVKPSSAKEYIKQNFNETTPAKYLKIHCPVDEVTNTIEATMVSEEIQKYLDISKNEPCLKISRVVISKGQIATYSELYYPSSRYKLTSTFS
jgi:GntR family histidine utilization transcriptional repressor